MSGRVLVLAPLMATATGRPRGAFRAILGGRSQVARPASPPAPDAEGFRRIMLPHLDAAHGFARYLCRDASAAEDVVQEAYLKAYHGFHAYRGGDAKAWLFAVVRSCFLDWARGQRRWDGLVSDEDIDERPDEAFSAETILMHRSDEASVRRAVEALPHPFREALVLRELQEMSYREIADVTEVPIGTVMSRLARARRLLAAALSEEGLP